MRQRRRAASQGTCCGWPSSAADVAWLPGLLRAWQCIWHSAMLHKPLNAANLYLRLGNASTRPRACIPSVHPDLLRKTTQDGVLRSDRALASAVLIWACVFWYTSRAGGFGRLSPNTASACKSAFSRAPGARELLCRSPLRSLRAPIRHGRRPRRGQRVADPGEAPFSLWR